MVSACKSCVVLCLGRRQREAGSSAADEQDQPASELPQCSNNLQLTRVNQSQEDLHDSQGAEAHGEEEARQQIQERLPGGDWKARIGTAGTPLEQQRVSPIVELSMILVQEPAPPHSPVAPSCSPLPPPSPPLPWTPRHSVHATKVAPFKRPSGQS